MAVPTNNWCTACEESVQDHSTICTTCGEVLGPAPTTTTTTTTSRTTTIRTGIFPPRPSLTGIRAENVQQTGDREIHNLLSGLQGPLNDMNLLLLAQRQQHEQQAGEEWEEIPAELLAPQNATHQGRPTSQGALAKIPRVVLHNKSSLFRQASLTLSFATSQQQCSAIPAEFGPSEAFQIQDATIVIAVPRTAKGGLSEECKLQIKEAREPLVYLERGDDITFVYKAYQAQQAGARAVIIGNNQSTPWPYVMKDSAGEAQKLGLNVPVVMIQQHEGKNLVEYCKQRNSLGHSATGELNILSLSKECAVCCDSYDVNDTIMTLPACHHVFHEKCALAWLTKHNTCPFCRRELPTDDTDYEQERRRTQRTHAGSAPVNGNQSQWSEFYG